MIFPDFVNALYNSFNDPLPGPVSHLLMSPNGRPLAKDYQKKFGEARRSAVLILFYPIHFEPHFVLIQRPKYEGTHSAQMSFPGGKMEKEDLSLKHTALRETQEEIGILPESIQVLGEITEVYIPPSNFLVLPFVGFLDEKPVFVKDDREVDEVVNIPVTELLDDRNIERGVVQENNEHRIVAPYFLLKNKVVWGATAVMLSEIRQMITSRWVPRS